MKTRAILFEAVDSVAVVDVQMPDPGPGEVLIETAYSCVSPGTELRCLAGKQSGVDFPFVPGYSLAGRIMVAGPETNLAVGTPVFCTGTAKADQPLAWGGHVAHALQPEGNVYPLPDHVELRDAAIIHLAAISYHGLCLSNPLPHEKVAVIGLGAIGQLSARLHALTGAHVVGADLSAQRAEQLRAVGVEAVVPTNNLAEAFRTIFPAGADVVVDATGAPGVMAQGIAAARELPWGDTPQQSARYVIQGSYADTFTVPYQDAFSKELRYLIPRDCQPRDFRAMVDVLARGLLRVDDLMTVASLDDAPHVYRTLQAQSGEMITAAFRWMY